MILDFKKRCKHKNGESSEKVENSSEREREREG